MPWFTNDPLPRPEPIDWRLKRVEEIKNYLPSYFRREEAVLKAFNFPLPIRKGDPQLSHAQGFPIKGDYAIIKLPSFDFPPHLVFKTHPLERGYKGGVYWDTPIATYVIFDDEETIQEIEKLYRERGLKSVVEKYPGQWFKRDPYAPYKHFNNVGADHMKGKIPVGQYGDLKNLSELPIWPPLEKFEGYTPRQLLEMAQHTHFYIELVHGCLPINYPLKANIQDNPQPIYADPPDNILFNLPYPSVTFDEDCITLKILPNQDTRPAPAEQFLDSLKGITDPIAFELIAEGGTMYFQITFDEGDAELIERQIKIYFPEFVTIPHSFTPQPAKPLYLLYVLTRQSLYRIRTDAGVEPYSQLFELFSQAAPGESSYMQVTFVPMPIAANQMVENHLKSLLNSPTYCNQASERLELLTKRIPLWITSINFFSTDQLLLEKIRSSYLSLFETPKLTLYKNPIRKVETYSRILSGKYITTPELAALAHFPNKAASSESLETASMKAKLPPDNYTTGAVVIGESEARGVKKPVTLPDSVRDRHVYIVGKSGMGKSTLITNAVIANMRAGEGVCVIDPHGDLVATGSQPLLDYVPEERIRDTIYFNAADKEYPLALNMLSAGKDEERSLLADNLLVMFRRQSDGWGPRMEDILRATLQTLMHTPGSSFLDIKRMLHNEAFRQSVVRRLDHPMLKEFWEEDYPASYNRRDAAAPILSRVNKFLYLPQLYAMLSSPESPLDFYDIIQSKKILLVNLSSGIIGEDNAQLLGSIIVTMLQMAAMRRAGIPPSQRHPFYLYVDEFQNFTTASFEKILSEARKYNLRLTLAHQYISQVSESQRDAIFGNVGTMIMFSCGDRDANALRYQLGSYEPQDLVNLKNYEAVCRPESAKETFPFKTIPPPEKPEGFAEAIIEHTQMSYATIIDPDEQQPEERDEEAPQPPQAARKTAQPAAALEKNFASKADELLYYIGQSEYLNTDQIKQLCYGHLAESARAPMASRDLKKLIDAKRLKVEPFGRGNIYYSGRTPKPTTHNLEVRNLYVKIARSGFEVAAVDFYPALPSLTPDLSVSFLTADGGLLKTYWEYDAGTEGIAELMKKVTRYGYFKDEAIISFVFATQERLEQVKRSVKEDYINFAVLVDISLITDEVFTQVGSGQPYRLFLPPT